MQTRPGPAQREEWHARPVGLLAQAAAAAQSREGGATLSRRMRMSALQNWEGFWRQSGRGLAAGACVDASRSPSWHSVVIWYGLAVSDDDGDMKQRRESWVAQGVRSYGKRRKGLAFQHQQMQPPLTAQAKDEPAGGPS